MQRTPPQKRRKTSPTTSIPIDASTSNSQLPDTQKDGAETFTRRPSFASPTKASIARHNPQLLNRPSSSGSGSGMPGNKGKLEDLFAKALGETRDASKDTSQSEQENRWGSEVRNFGQEGHEGQALDPQRPITPKAKGALRAKPRRRSQSPAKATEPAAPMNVEIVGGGLPNNPFVKRSGLRRSPVSSQAEPISANSPQTDDKPKAEDPFQKRTGLRRSPTLSQPHVINEPSPVQDEPSPAKTPPRKSALRRSPVFSQPLEDLAEPIGQIGTHPGLSPVRKGALRRSPVMASSQPIAPIVHEDSPFEEQPEKPLTRQPELRMSPALAPNQSMPPSSPSIPQHGDHPGISPVRKGALRRSPVGALSNQSLIDSLLTSDDEDSVVQSSSIPVFPVMANITGDASVEREPEALGVKALIDRKLTLEKPPDTPLNVEQTNSPTIIDPDVSTTPKESPPASVTNALEMDDAQQEESEASLLKEVDFRPATRGSALRNSQRQQELVVPLAFPRVALEGGTDQHGEETETPLLQESAGPSPRSGSASRRQHQQEPIVALPFPRKALVNESELLLGSPLKNRPEPELPPTPTQRGIPDPVVTTPPAGIHNTPSKRARRSKAQGEKLKSSPLKPRDPTPVESSLERIPNSYPEASQASKASSKGQPKEILTRRKSARFTVPPDPHAAKKAARDALLNQLQQLQTDVEIANQECERLRLQQETRKKRAHAASNTDELIDLLQRHAATPSKPDAKPTSIFKLVNSFLPFSSRRVTQAVNIADFRKPVPSHRSIQLNEPLPYLKAFATLDFKSTITLLPADQVLPGSATQETEQPVLQNHLISLSHPSGLFSAQVNMIVDSSKLQIKEITIPRLELSAEKELGMFVRNRTKAQGTAGNDISVMCWAMGRWTETAIKRAKTWHTIQSEFGTPEARASSLKKLGKKKRRRVLDEVEDEEGSDSPTRRDLLAHMGRTNMEITSSEVELLIEWKIRFDWTGEAENYISASARIPCSWHTADDRGSLSKIPETFGRLVKEKGTLRAVRAVVGLLMSGA